MRFKRGLILVLLLLGCLCVPAGAAESDVPELFSVHFPLRGDTGNVDTSVDINVESDMDIYSFKVVPDNVFSVQVIDFINFIGGLSQAADTNGTCNTFNFPEPLKLTAASRVVRVSIQYCDIPFKLVFYGKGKEPVPEEPTEPEKPPEEPPEPEKPKPKKLFLKSSFPDYLLKNSISLEFSSPVKDLSVQLLDEEGQEVSTKVDIRGSSATVQITDSAFQSGQPYTFKLLGATAEDGGTLDKPISHSFKEMISSGNQGFDMVMMAILSMFTESKTQGLIIVILAVCVGLIFVLGRWLWEMSRVWLRRSKY